MMSTQEFLHGKVLIAMPDMRDERFAQSLVYVCAHSENGAMGLIINKLTPLMFFSDLVTELKLVPEDVQQSVDAALLGKPVLYGGPVEPFRGFVLHSRDYFLQGTSLPVSDVIALTSATDVLYAMVKGEGPKKAIIALGYSGWVGGQLENELLHNGWLHCDATDELLFGDNHKPKYAAALRQIGVDPLMLSSSSGHA